MLSMTINLRKLRSDFGYSQTKLSHKSKVSLPTIQNIEAGKANPTIDILEKIIKAFGYRLKLEPLEFNINVAIDLGVPLTRNLSFTYNFKPNAKLLIDEVKKWHHVFMINCLNEREEIALVSFLMALNDHFYAFYQDEISSPLFNKKISEYRKSGKAIKLRRIALTNLSKYL